MPAVILFAAETSKVPFYILGGAVAVWAVVLAGLGLRQPDFPYNARGQAGVIVFTLVMIVLAIGAAILTA